MKTCQNCFDRKTTITEVPCVFCSRNGQQMTDNWTPIEGEENEIHYVD